LVNDASMQSRRAMHNQNPLKIGLFAANCSSGRAVTLVPERWSASWEDNLRMARIADEAGIDFLLPVARWKPYGVHGDYQINTFETITWATGLLASTQRITIFGTVHAPLFNPVMAAKQMVTADHVGGGRFGLNLVVGWNEGEFDMFGVPIKSAHDDRYEYAQEWIDAVKDMWSPKDNFDVVGKYLQLKSVRSSPKPVGGTRPVIMNAGMSPVGRAFAMRNCDAFFTNTIGMSVEQQAEVVKSCKAEARTQGRELDVYTTGDIVCRPTQKEAEDYAHHAIFEMADWKSVDDILALRKITPDTMSPEDFRKRRELQAKGMGGVPLVGSPDHIADKLAALVQAGLRGIAVSFVNYADELPYFVQEVLPRLERQGVRVPVAAT
jgi:alkanesulfonate monooxygenase SsuD/methylene tetrahydromethanopterin reductase-like flavin-dependent oxidoreductase (luciferase family)